MRVATGAKLERRTKKGGNVSTNGNGATDRILSKSRVMEYLTLDGLSKMTGVSPDLLDFYTLKELTDNALDSAELGDTLPEIQVMVSRQTDTLRIAVADQGAGISPEMVREVTNFERFGGTKYFVKKPTRGAQGNALMTIVGLVSALWREQGRAVPPAIVFSSRGYRHEVSLRIDPVLEKAWVSVESVKISGTDGGSDVDQKGTSIEVFLPLPYGACGQRDRYTQVIENFSLWNPHASFKFTYYMAGADGLSLPFPSTAKTATRFIQDGYGSPHWYTIDDFERLLFANVRALEESGESETTLDFAKRFKGCSSNRKEFTEKLRKGMPKRLNDIRDPKTSERLFTILLAATPPPSASVLGEVGKEHMRSSADQWKLVDKLFKYKKVQGFLDGTSIPFVLEVAVAPTEKLTERRVSFGINGTVTYKSPFEEDLYQPTKLKERDAPWQKVKGLRELLGSYRIGPQDPVMIAIHLLCPNIRYGDYGKSSFDTGSVKIPIFQKPSDLHQSGVVEKIL
jgi:hypothetical protein